MSFLRDELIHATRSQSNKTLISQLRKAADEGFSGIEYSYVGMKAPEEKLRSFCKDNGLDFNKTFSYGTRYVISWMDGDKAEIKVMAQDVPPTPPKLPIPPGVRHV